MRVLYTRLYNLGNYENERFEVEDEVGEDELPSEVAERLRLLVEGMKTDADYQRREARRLAQAPENAF